MKPDFQYFEPKNFLSQVKVKKNSILGKKYLSVRRSSIIRESNKTKINNLAL